MKKPSICFLLMFTTQFLFAQNNSFFEGPETDVAYKGVGAVKGTAGIIGDNYYVVENDYGRALDFNNNIRTILSVMSIKTGNLVKRISLNELVAAQASQEINKILFCGVVTWKDKVVGFYTYKDPNGTDFKAYAIILNSDGKPENSGQEIGPFTHELLVENIPGQTPGRKGGRNTLSVANDLWFGFTRDSSRLFVQCTPESGSGNIRFKIYKPGMVLEKDISAVVPVKGKKETIIQFAMNPEGIIYLITKGDKYTLHTINTTQNNKLISKDIELAGKNIANASLGFTEKGTAIIAGTYQNNSKGSGMHGAFAFKADPLAAQFSIHTRDIPDSVIETYAGKKALRKGDGIFEYIQLIRFAPKTGGGLYAFGQSNSSYTMARGSTGALNSYYQETWLNAAYSIDEDGKILWESIAGLQIANRELATRHSRIEYTPAGETVHGLIVLPNPEGVHDYFASASGTSELPIIASKEIMKYPFVEGTLRIIGEKDFAVIGFNEGRNAKMRLVKIHL